LDSHSKIPEGLIWIQDIISVDIDPLTSYFEKNYPECRIELGPGKKEIVGLYGDPHDAQTYECLREFYDYKLSLLKPP
jgi:hypothetical protein